MPASRTRNHMSGEPDEIALLSLSEVRERLARNERVLNTGPLSLSSSPVQSYPAFVHRLSTSPTSPALRRTSAPSPETPVRERLLQVRRQLQAREQELMIEEAREGMEDMEFEGKERGEGSGPRRASLNGSRSGNNYRSGKQRAMDIIRQGDIDLPRGSLILPISESLALGERDFDNQTAADLASMSISSSSRSKRSQPERSNKAKQGYTPRTTDEISEAQQAARLNAFMRHKAAANEEDDDDEDMFDIDEEYKGEEEREYDGSGMPLDPTREEEGNIGDHEEEEDGGGNFEEGNDEYGEVHGVGTMAGMEGRNVILSEK